MTSIVALVSASGCGSGARSSRNLGPRPLQCGAQCGGVGGSPAFFFGCRVPPLPFFLGGSLRSGTALFFLRGGQSRDTTCFFRCRLSVTAFFFRRGLGSQTADFLSGGCLSHDTAFLFRRRLGNATTFFFVLQPQRPVGVLLGGSFGSTRRSSAASLQQRGGVLLRPQLQRRGGVLLLQQLRQRDGVLLPPQLRRRDGALLPPQLQQRGGVLPSRQL